jgi:hypothetical protein
MLARKFNNDMEPNPMIYNDVLVDLDSGMMMADYISCEWLAFRLLGHSVVYTEEEIYEIYDFNTTSVSNIKFVS